jgi:hypothetical protein
MEQQSRRGRGSRDIPITGISLFIAERKAEALQKHTELRKVQLYALLNDEWNALDNASRRAYERRADYSRRMESRRQHKNAHADMQPKVSSYSVFTRERHGYLKQTHPEMTVGTRAQLIASEWKTMRADDKLPYVNAAKRETRKMQKRSMEEEYDENSDEVDEKS